MLKPSEFFSVLQENEVEFFTGVPDSLLKDFCAYVTDNVSEEDHIIAANEGNAIGVAAGYHLSTGKIPLVYMQNSGMGNATNPLLSLVDQEVYEIPALLMIGWRGEPGKEDACQHIKQGRITRELFDTMEIPNYVLPEDISEARDLIEEMVEEMHEDGKPRALVVRRGTFSEYTLDQTDEVRCEMSREEAIEKMVESVEWERGENLVVSSTGKISRELYEVRERLDQDHDKDFLMVGSMGHASQITLGAALKNEHKQVICVEGDGSLIMHMGGLTTISLNEITNLKHVILNNCAHDSVGGQPTAAPVVDFQKIAEGAGYKKVMRVQSSVELEEKMEELLACEGPALLEIKVEKGAREDLGRPDIGPLERKEMFMDFLQD